MMAILISCIIWLFSLTPIVYIAVLNKRLNIINPANYLFYVHKAAVLVLLFNTAYIIYSVVGFSSADLPSFLLSYSLINVAVINILTSFVILFMKSRAWQVGNNQQFVLYRKYRTTKIIITLYLVLTLTLLLYPEVKIHDLIWPPAPDLKSAFLERFQGQPAGVIEKIREYLLILLLPFYFIAVLTVYRRNFIKLSLCLLILPYVNYVDQAYLSRGEILHYLFLFFFLVLYFSRLNRKILYLASLGLFGLFISFSYVYASVRIGGSADDADILSVVQTLFLQEISTVSYVGQQVFNSSSHADFFGYHTWLLTFFIPKIIFPSFSNYILNYDISSLVLNVNVGADSFYVVLPGLFFESYFIYGGYFWVHAIVISIFFASIIYFISRLMNGFIVFFYYGFIFIYDLNRGGVTAFLPEYFTPFILLFAVIIFKKMYQTRCTNER